MLILDSVCVCNCRSVHKVTHLGVLQQVKCWKKKLKITSCHSGHATIGCFWFPDRLRKGLWHSAGDFWSHFFQFSKCYTEFGAFAKTNTTHQGTKMFYLEKDTTFIASKFKKLLFAAFYGLWRAWLNNSIQTCLTFRQVYHYSNTFFCVLLPFLTSSIKCNECIHWLNALHFPRLCVDS